MTLLHKIKLYYRDIWCTGADFYDLLQSQRLTALVNCCTMGDVNVLREILNEAKSNGEEELMHQLEQRLLIIFSCNCILFCFVLLCFALVYFLFFSFLFCF